LNAVEVEEAVSKLVEEPRLGTVKQLLTVQYQLTAMDCLKVQLWTFSAMKQVDKLYLKSARNHPIGTRVIA